MTHLSVVGCGNMGGALLQGLAHSGDHTLVGCDIDPDARASVADYCETTDDLAVAAEAEYVVLAVKPDSVSFTPLQGDGYPMNLEEILLLHENGFTVFNCGLFFV